MSQRKRQFRCKEKVVCVVIAFVNPYAMWYTKTVLHQRIAAKYGRLSRQLIARVGARLRSLECMHSCIDTEMLMVRFSVFEHREIAPTKFIHEYVFEENRKRIDCGCDCATTIPIHVHTHTHLATQ